MPATRMNRAGNRAMLPPRAMTISPSPSGCASVRRTARSNSGASSRHSTPPWARAASPGCRPAPPPVTAAMVARVVRDAQRRPGDPGPPGPQQPGGRVDGGHLRRLLLGQVGQQRDQPGGQRRNGGLPGPGQAQVVAPRRADLQHLPQYGRDAQPGQARVLVLDRAQVHRRPVPGGGARGPGARRAARRPPGRSDSPGTMVDAGQHARLLACSAGR